MDEQTITQDPVLDTGAQALPVEDTAGGAEQSTEQNQVTGAEALPEKDDKLASFAKGQGIDDLSSLNDREKSLLKMAYDSKADRDRVANEASKLQKDISVQPTHNGTEVARVAAMEAQLALMNFKSTHTDWQEHSDAMNTLLEEPYTTAFGTFPRKEYIQNGLMTYEDVYFRAKANNPVKQENVEQVLQSIANKQRAGGGLANAINQSPKAPDKDPVIEAIRKSRES